MMAVKLLLKIGEEKENYRVEIRDTGAGIGKEHSKKIFNPFFTTKREGKRSWIGYCEKDYRRASRNNLDRE